MRNVKEKLVWSSDWDGSWFGELEVSFIGMWRRYIALERQADEGLEEGFQMDSFSYAITLLTTSFGWVGMAAGPLGRDTDEQRIWKGQDF